MNPVFVDIAVMKLSCLVGICVGFPMGYFIKYLRGDK